MGTPTNAGTPTREKEETDHDPAPLPHSNLAARRGFGISHGMRLASGIAVPYGMRLPAEDGWRTPTIEDYEHGRFDRLYTRHGPVRYAMPSPRPSGHGSPRKSLSRNLNLKALSDRLDEKLSWKVRIRYFTWAAFTMNMATGGVANVLYNVPFRFRGLDTIGTIFFLFNIVLYLINVACISTRFYLYPETFMASLKHPTESLFMPACVVSFGTILLNIVQYGFYNVGYWLNTAMLVMFWIDAVLAILASAGTYLMLWTTTTFTIKSMTPIWIFPAYPLLIIGPQAALLSKSLAPDQAQIIIVAGFTLQGIGYLVSLMIYAAFIYRLMTQKLPKESSRPAMFVSVGPSGFTAGAVVALGSDIQRAFGDSYGGDGELAALILRLIAEWMSLWIWGLACWFFFVAVGAHFSCIRHGGLQFSLPFFSFIFPNTALLTATFAIAKAFGSYALNIVGTVGTVILVIVWFLVFGGMLRAIWKREIFWPQRQEDRDEGGFQAPDVKVGSRGAAIILEITKSSEGDPRNKAEV